MSVHLTVLDGVGLVDLDRAPANALDLTTCRQLLDAVTRAAGDPEARAIVLAGRGSRFCGGGDVAGMAAADEPGALLGEMADTVHQVIALLHGLEKPVVCAVQGAAAGAGLALSLAADVVVAEEGAVFVAGYPGIGLSPDCGMSWTLPRAVGSRRAASMLLLDHRVDASEGLEWGLVTEVVARGLARDRALELAARLTQGAAGSTRRLLQSAWTQPLQAHLDDEAARVVTSARSQASRVLVARFAAPA